MRVRRECGLDGSNLLCILDEVLSGDYCMYPLLNLDMTDMYNSWPPFSIYIILFNIHMRKQVDEEGIL